jgi:putative endonuclease
VGRRRTGWQVYVLRCGDGSLYTGATSDLPRRVACHAAGRGARYTRSHLPVRLVHAEAAPDRGTALRREAAIKRLPRRKKLALLAGRPRSA